MLNPVIATSRADNGHLYTFGWWVEGDDEHFALKGDSGAIVVDEEDAAVGMVVAIDAPGFDEPHLTFVHAISAIMSALEVELP